MDENVIPYRTEGHRHGRRSTRSSRRSAAPAPVTFVPHLLPLDQGELASCYVPPDARARRARSCGALYAERYADEPFVERRRRAARACATSATRTSARSTSRSTERGRVLAFAAIDNLWKGAAGPGDPEPQPDAGARRRREGLERRDGFFRSRWVDAARRASRSSIPPQLAPGFRAGAASPAASRAAASTDVGLLVCDAERGRLGAAADPQRRRRGAGAGLPRASATAAAIRAAVVNSGNANAATGEQGYRDALAMRDAAARGARPRRRARSPSPRPGRSASRCRSTRSSAGIGEAAGALSARRRRATSPRRS